VVLNGPTAINDNAAGNGASFSKTYNLAAGYYTGNVTATDTAGLTSAACSIAQFLVGNEPALTPPTGLAAGTPTATSVPLAWNAAGGATGYHVYVNGARATSAPVASTSYTVGGLTANTTYSITVSSVGSAGESAQSTPVTVTTAGGGWACTTVTSSNYAHVQAGRAHATFGLAYANGSNDLIGLNSIFFRSTLAQTAEGYYKVGACP
jgi:poly(3-hydroxybutyrate) depolymerase